MAAILGVAILAASTISVEIGISVALIELGLGVVVGNALDVSIPGWLAFVGSFSGIVLTFLAGAEVDVPQLRREWRASLSLGAVSFAAPFLIAMAVAYWVLGWTREQAEIAGLALSTTSLAVVYAVLVEQERLRVVAFAFLTPLFFLRGGMSVSVGALWANLGILFLLLAAKMAPKLVGVYPLARRYCAPHGAFTTLLMSTGLTFGTISSLYGLNAGIIDRTQFSLLVTVVVLSAIVPTAIAQRFFQPSPAEETVREAALRVGHHAVESEGT